MNERRGREYWSEQVAEWRGSGLSKKAYSERHGLPYSSLCRWAGKLAATPASEPLVELGQLGGGAEPRVAIELVVGRSVRAEAEAVGERRASARGALSSALEGER